ncbi:MAG: hypothetical protein RIQ53_2067 [Pseudomonadota bacterium]
MIEAVEFMGQPAMRLVAPDGAEATVLLHGAHIVSWIPAGDQERFYVSPTTGFGPGTAVRGGVPVCWPQFNMRGPLPCKHGLVRDRAWQWDAQQSAVRAGAAIGVLTLRDDAATRAIWPQGFEAELTLVLSGLELDIELAITNSGDTPMTFTGALHSYFKVDDVRRSRLGGLFGVEYLDTVIDETHRQEFDPMSFVGEIDRIYWNAGGADKQPLILATHMGRMGITAEGLPDVVVWNPGPAKAAALPDLPDEDWPRFLCVEAALIGEPVTLAPGEHWSGRQSLAV